MVIEYALRGAFVALAVASFISAIMLKTWKEESESEEYLDREIAKEKIKRWRFFPFITGFLAIMALIISTWF